MKWISSIFSWFLSFLKTLDWNSLRPILLKYLYSNTVKLALKKILRSAVAGGFRAWIIKFVIKEYIFKKALEPIVKAAFREAGYIFHVVEGNHNLKKVEEARENGNQTEYDSAMDDLIG